MAICICKSSDNSNLESVEKQELKVIFLNMFIPVKMDKNKPGKKGLKVKDQCSFPEIFCLCETSLLLTFNLNYHV